MHSAARTAVSAAILLLASTAGAQTTTKPPASTTTAAAPSITEVSECHPHGTVQWCMVGTEEYQVVGPTRTEEMESKYTDCHTHGSDTYCVTSEGEDVQILVESEEQNEEQEEEDPAHPAKEGEHCHFHAGVEHCVGAGESENGGKRDCGRKDRDYNVPLRIGLLFVILVTSAIGVFLPVLATSFTRMTEKSVVFVVLKQFGTGVVLSTAFIHLFTHASLMFTNECIGEMKYEGTTAAILMAGLFLSFLVDYAGARFIQWRQHKSGHVDAEDRSNKDGTPDSGVIVQTDDRGIHGHAHGQADETVGVMVLEAGIIFHSLLIGLTLVVAGDSFFLTLFAVIVFHQMFEGIALGACIAALPAAKASLFHKFLMGMAFALITPIGMAIGIGVLDKFNGNDPSTLIAIGTLDALSAGILVWVGLVEMLARDWMHGMLLHAGLLKTGLALIALIAGMALMSFLGKWA